MKRSEMLKCIEDILVIIHKDPSPSGRSVLFYIEQKGMLPPCKSKFGKHLGNPEWAKLNRKCDDYIESCDFNWEEECDED